ncbi:Ipi1p [Sporobolomyces koalae]|uniref:Ipi1p n=1 Tax=Sporobolomyces koalae TaxID=500713 RepID=UPI00317BD772
MPKSAKHKKERAADFKKAKLKLGKGKQIANNATNTSFTAKTIALPNQSLHEAPKDVPTSRRNLTLSELLVQSRHYSVPVKREALTEILQLVTAHPYLLNQNLLALTTSIAHLIADASPSVRTASRNLLAHIADNLPPQSLVSVSQGLVLFTLSALSNLDETIRIDALKVLDLLLEKIPHEIVRGWDGNADVHAQLGKSAEEMETGSKVVEGLLGMLKIRNPALQAAQGNFTNASSSDLSPSARLAVLTTLASFLRTSLSPVASTSTAPPPWYLAPSFDSPRAYSTFLGSFGSTASSSPLIPVPAESHARPTSFPIEPESTLLALASNPTTDLALGSFGLYSTRAEPSIASTSSTSTPIVVSATAPPQTLLTLVHPTLLSSFLDAAPTAFSPTPILGQTSQQSSAELQVIAAVLKVARELFYRDLGGNNNNNSSSTVQDGGDRSSSKLSERGGPAVAKKLLTTLLGHVASYFPFGGDELHPRTTFEEEQLLQLNLTFAELVSLLVLSGSSSSSNTDQVESTSLSNKNKNKKKQQQGTDAAKIELILSTVQSWVIGALACTLTSLNHPLGLPPLSLEAFVALEPTLWSLLNQPNQSQSNRVWEAILNGWNKMGKETEVRRRAFEFIARGILIQSEPTFTDRFDLDPSGKGQGVGLDKTTSWVVGLSKWLWELSTKQPDTTQLVIEFLLKVAQQEEKGVLPCSTLPTLAPVLVPFFHLAHPTRGSMPGPFTKFGSMRVQSKCLDLASYLVRTGEGDSEAEKEGRDRLRQSVERAVRSAGIDESLKQRWQGLV